MDKQHKNLAQRVLAAILCVAMLLPVFPQTAWAEEESNLVIREQTSDPILAAASTPVNAKSVLSGIPYQGGAGSTLLEYDCGNGVSRNGAKSCIRIITGTDANDFNRYCTSVLETRDRQKVYSKDIRNAQGTNNLYRKYVAANGSYSVYTYFLANYGETRIIVDTNLDTVNGYSYTPQAGVSVEPKLVMWGLSTSETGYHLDANREDKFKTGKENNGVMLIIRMRDNSLFFYDGGIMAQMSDAESAELLAFCRELTGTTPGEKMVINTWFVSHAHDDHFQAFGRFININHNHFDLKNVVYNIDKERGDVRDVGGEGITPASKDLREALDVITTYYPNVKYYKPHTGETFNVAGIEFDVLYTHEDRLQPRNDSLSFHEDKLATKTPAQKAAGQKEIDIKDIGGTYRDVAYKDGKYTANGQTDFNDTSTVIRVRFENGVNGIFYGDLNLAENIVLDIHSSDALKTDIMLVPHHLFDNHDKLVRVAKSKVYLISQRKSVIYGADNNYTTLDTDNSSRDDLRKNFESMMDTLTGMDQTEGVNYDIFWGGSETVIIDINALGALLGKSSAPRAALNGSYYTTEKANSFTYTGWTMSTTAAGKFQSAVNSAEDYLSAEKADAVSVSNTQAVFTRHGDTYFVQEGRYLLMSDKYGHIMSFDATASPEIAPGEQHGTSTTGSITLDADGGSENTYYFDRNGNVILDNSDRHFVIWNMRQYKEATNGTSLVNGASLVASGDSTFGGSAIFKGIELQKRTATQNPYWYVKDLAEGEDYQLRYFCFKSDSTCFKNYYRNSLQTTKNDVYGDQSGSRVKFIIDSLGDGTYLLYFKESNTDYRVVTCDEYGNWDVIRYKGDAAVSNMRKDLAKLKLRLYEYKESDEVKSVAFSGNQEYLVPQGSDVTGILNDIGMSITVFDAAHKNQHIPYDGSEVTKTNFYGTEYPVTKKAGYYWLDGSGVNTNVVGEYPVYIKYRNDNGSDTTIGELRVVVGGFSYSNVPTSGTVTKKTALSGNVISVNNDGTTTDLTFVYNGQTVNLTVGMLTDTSGRFIDTSKPGTYPNLTLTYNGTVLTETFTLTVEDSIAAMDYPAYPDPGSVTVNKVGTTSELDFSKNGIANIQLSATAKPEGKGVDLIIIMDLSSSMRYHVYNSEPACGPMYNTDGTRNTNIAKENGQDNLNYAYSDRYWKNTRMYAMEEALKDMVNKLSATSENADIRIAMADFGDLDHYEFKDASLDSTIGTPAGSKPYWDADGNDTGTLEYEMSNHVNFILGRDDKPTFGGLSQPYWLDQPKHNLGYKQNNNGTTRTYTGKLLPKIYTGSNTLNSDAFEDVDSIKGRMDSIINDLRIMNGKRLGTNYDIGLETAYRLAYAREQANIAAGVDREIVCIFMSDGAAMQYNYLSGRAATEAWSQCIIGETDEIVDTQNVADRYVITSDYGDTSVYQNPLLKEMIQKLAGLLRPAGNLTRSSLVIPNTNNSQYYTGYTGSSTDFFEMMKAVGVDCDWELFWKIAWTNYTIAETNSGYYNALKIPSLNLAQNLTKTDANGTVTKIFCDKTMERVVMSMRTPSFKRGANNNEQYQYQTLSPYYYFYNTEGKNWWAEALKGDVDKLYPVINRFAFEDSREWGDVDFYYGDVRNNFSTGKGLALDGKDYISGFRGLGLDLYTIGFSLATDGRIDYSEASKVLDNIATGTSYHYETASQDGLKGVLTSITSTMSAGATRAWFTDTLGDDYELSDNPTTVDANGNLTGGNWIRVLERPLTGSTAPVVRETIYFADLDGDGDLDAWSDQKVGIDANGNKVTEDIWDEKTNLINGKYVIYNANVKTESNPGTQSIAFGEQGTYPLPAETFFWTIGVLGETEMVLEYQVYLTGSCDNSKVLPFARQYYDTNEQAKLTYVNYLGNSCWLPTKTPKYPWGSGAMEDIIVIDFGVPVEIDVLNNDTMFTNPTLIGINKGYEPTSSVQNMNGLSFTTSGSVEGTYGFLKIENGKLTYTLKTQNSMQYNNVEEFTYAMQNHASNDTKYYFGKIKILPATTIYYEDDFVTFKSHNRADGSLSNTSVWSDSGEKVDKTQAQDRPGEDVNNALGNLDADNVYGYDGAYTAFDAHSQGYAKRATVDANTYGTATFSFYGTGFDVISLSNRTTGTIVVSVYDYSDYEKYLNNPTGTKLTSKKDAIVDTYYGYKYENGSWVVDPTESATLYQVPVIKMSDLPYGRYTAVITISYSEFFDHQKDGSYDFYLDAIRIYDPANDGKVNDVIEDAYFHDDEGWPEYFELRNLLINKNTFDSLENPTDSVRGIIFIDGFPALQNSNGNHTNDSSSANLGNKSAVVKDYANFGPNNELYLAPNQAVAFQLSIPGTDTVKVASIQLAFKSVGGEAYIKVYDANAQNTPNVVAPSSTVDARGGSKVSTATDLYYNITSLNNKTVVIANTGTEGILSITNIKVTYTAEYSNNINSDLFTTTTRAARTAIRSINDLFANVGEQDPGEVVNGTINIAGASLSFEDEILTNLYYTLSGVEATEMGLLTWSAEPADGTIDNAENVFVGAKYDAQKDRYMVQTSGIAAKNLGDTIYMRVYAKTAEGVVYSDLVTYSPKQYAMSRLEKSTNADMKALCVAMLNYGAAAQQYFGYKTDALMNAELTAEQKVLASDYSADLFAGAVKADGAKIGAFTKTDGFAARSASVSFDGAFAINYYFAPNAKMNGDMTFYYWSAEDYANADVLTAENATGTSVMELTDNGSYWANITGIAAKQLDETFYVAAVYADADGNTYCTGVIAYSLSTYCMKNAVEGNAMKQLAEATAVYGYHASVYFGDEA